MTDIFWRCVHHPSAIENYFFGFGGCAHGCDLTTLRWHDNGFHQKPLYQGTMRGSQQWAELQKNGL